NLRKVTKLPRIVVKGKKAAFAGKSVKAGKKGKANKIVIRVGQFMKLKAKFTKNATAIATWKSSKPKVAKVDAAGKLTALKKGTTKITLKVGNKKQVIKITVR
ncbi:MAG: Ig-like domain-containing protein, partial [Clostridiales Family XIII bacterium]|nr:Ig-like domain-containing protein [Clostridiales Family XIII bacterium]